MFGRKCSDCGGAVVDNVCKNCGQSFTGQQRRKGLKFILIGSILVVAGIVLSYATYNPSSGSMWLFYGPIVLGAFFIVGGLIALIFGTRV
jgi:polyferredoxin